jgi:hypothetical protein
MTLAQEKFAHAEDGLLLRQIKEQKWDHVKVMLGTHEGKALTRHPDVYGNLMYPFMRRLDFGLRSM